MLKESNDNALFCTEQCNNHCIMCCQPPKKIDDIDFLYNKNLEIIDEAPEELPVIGLTGGEPTLMGDKLFSLIDYIREKYPQTTIHILSNGRTFADRKYVKRLIEHTGKNMFIGIPLHSDYSKDHDVIAGAKNAYNETMLGLYNLAEEGVDIELRIVVNAMNYQRLPQMSEFIFKNLSFVEWTAFMAMEHVGFARNNFKKVWIEPKDYIKELSGAVFNLHGWDLPVSIYNIPLCLLPEGLHPFAAQSISDWKTKYMDICAECVLKEKCCGLFATSEHTFEELRAIII